MEYKDFYVTAFEREPGKWRGRVQRVSGKPMLPDTRLFKFETLVDAATAEAAMVIALADIDAGIFQQKRRMQSEGVRKYNNRFRVERLHGRDS